MKLPVPEAVRGTMNPDVPGYAVPGTCGCEPVAAREDPDGDSRAFHKEVLDVLDVVDIDDRAFIAVRRFVRCARRGVAGLHRAARSRFP